MPRLDDIEGIGPAFAAKLADAGLQTTDDLLGAGGSASGRDELASKTGISGSLILEWVDHADLYRIDGAGSEYADRSVPSEAEVARWIEEAKTLDRAVHH